MVGIRGLGTLCDLARQDVGDDRADRRFVWLYPFVESRAAAQKVCVDLGKPLAYDCLPWSADE